ncbi:LacI family transcriptional regulator [Eubacteriales bacterium OttesenSCG-928-A19]|nr:LacI family transcriptional regulator [Eubacteriales bacterium OttesenSCG-928-A19]
MKVTIKDVARKAGVNPSTVSRVLSGSPRISEDTRRRVLTILREMDYQPNQVARSLANRQGRIVSVVLPFVAEKTLSDLFNYSVIIGITTVAQQNGYHVLFSTGIEESDAGIENLNQLIRGGYVGGVVLLTSRIRDSLAELLYEQGFPFVVLGHPARDNEVNWVDNDNCLACRTATEYLLERGHRHIAFLGYAPDFRATTDRMRGYREALASAGAPFYEQAVLRVPYSDTTFDLSAFDQVFQRETPRPTALIAMNDALAISAIERLRVLGLSVPDDISVISFNNTVIGAVHNPPLTTIDLEPLSLGRRILELLVQAIHHPELGTNRAIVPFHLIERGSVREVGGRPPEASF